MSVIHAPMFAGDRYWPYVLAYLPLDSGPTFIEKKNGYTISQIGANGSDIVSGSGQTLFGGYSARFDPTIGSLNNKCLQMQIPNTDYDWSDDFTIRLWVYAEAIEGGASAKCVWWAKETGGSLLQQYLSYNSTGYITWVVFGSSGATTSNHLTIGSFNFVTLSKTGSNLYIGINGTVESISTTTSVHPTTRFDFQIGAQDTTSTAGQWQLRGAMREFQIIKSNAVYISNHSVPSRPFQAG